MSTIVYQNLVSCFETQFKETSTTIKLKFAAAPPPPPPPPPPNSADVSKTIEYDKWGFLQTYPKEPVQKNSFYTSSPFSRLSPTSLELCTESLGSESGSDVITDSSCNVSMFSGPPSSGHSNFIENSSSYLPLVELEKPKQAERNITKKAKNFPPPLTTLCWPSSLQMCRRREGGRLIIDAAEAPFRNSYLQAERSEGRLRLYFLTGSDTAVTTSTTTSASSTVEEEEEEEDEEEEESENECGGEKAAPEEIQSEIESGKEGFEMGMDKVQRLSRCKEGGHGRKGLCSVWEPAFCVAT